jgi:hypothetical protein
MLALLALIFGVIKILYMFRARAMRALAARWGFQYNGLSASSWRASSSSKVRPSLPASFPLTCHPPGRRIRQVWNVIEGEQSGISVLLFDSIAGEGRGAYCTFIACQTEDNPFGMDISPDRLIRSGEWTALYRVRFLQIPWTMNIQRLEDYVNRLRLTKITCR